MWLPRGSVLTELPLHPKEALYGPGLAVIGFVPLPFVSQRVVPPVMSNFAA
ncbi:MAG: hypothetical protein ACP5TI_04980 [Thermoprotei archaeon]